LGAAPSATAPRIRACAGAHRARRFAMLAARRVGFACGGGLRCFAQGGQPALVLVDGSQNLELVRAQLSLRLAANSKQGVDVLIASRQGVAIAFRAVAQLRRNAGGVPPSFRLAKAFGEELSAAGLAPSGHGARLVGEEDPEEDGAGGRHGFRLSLLPAAGAAVGTTAAADSPIAKVLRVAGGSAKFVPLAKAVATEVARLPDGFVSAVETTLRGKSKNVWTRTYKLAQAVAQAHQWQVAPANDRLVTRRFRCVLEERQSEDEVLDALVDGGSQADKDADAGSGDFRVLRIILIPEDPLPSARTAR